MPPPIPPTPSNGAVAVPTAADGVATHYNTHGHVAAAAPPPLLPPLPDLSIPPPSVAAPAPDINDLWARLQSSGVLSLFGSGGSGGISGLSAAGTKGGETAGIPGGK
jgi:hypothetical protein